MRRSTASGWATVLLVLAGGCGGETATDPAGSPTGSPTGTGTGGSAPWVCPREAPEPGGPEYGATGRPSLPEATTARVCRYPVAPSSPPAEPPEPVRLEGELAAELVTALGRAEPASEEQMCTQELGPTYLVLLPSDGNEVWVRVEAFGCTAMRIRDAEGVWGPLWNAPRRAVGLLGR